MAEEFWTQALELLQPEEKKQLSTIDPSSADLMTEIIREARAKRDAAASKRWKFKRSNGTNVILRDVFEKILGWVSKYAKVVDVAVAADPIHAGLPWAMIRFLLQVPVSDMQAFGSLSEGIELVAGLLVRYRIIESYCSSTTPVTAHQTEQYLDNCIVKVYTAILRYLSMANKYWSQNTAVRMAKGIFKDMEAEHCTLQSVVSKADDEAFRTINIFQNRDLFNISKETQETLNTLLDEIKTPFSRIAQDVAQIQDVLDQDQRKQVFHWLSTVPCELHHHESCKKIIEGTGQWLLECSELVDWVNSSNSAILWLNGIPGCGKSKLTSIVIQTFLRQNTDFGAQRPPLAYFYCSQKSTDPRTADPREIMCAILRQLAGRDARLPLRGGVGKEFQSRKELGDLSGSQVMRLDIHEAVAHILAIAEEDPLVIVLDALDEVDETERTDLFDALEQIVQESQNVVKIFISSRNDGDIVDRFQRYSAITVNDLLNQKDIEQFIQCKVTDAIRSKKILRGKVSTSLRDDIGKVLADGAQGM